MWPTTKRWELMPGLVEGLCHVMVNVIAAVRALQDRGDIARDRVKPYKASSDRRVT